MNSRVHIKGRIDIVHDDEQKKKKIRALILEVVEFNKFFKRAKTDGEIFHRLENLGELAREAETALNGLNIPVLNDGDKSMSDRYERLAREDG